MTSSPFLLNGSVSKHSEKFEDSDREFVNKILESFFVDDFTSGEYSKQKVVELYKKLKLRFLEGHFFIRKWRTNHPQVREFITEIEELKEDKPKPEKILGLMWDEINDNFLIHMSEIVKHANEVEITKRNILSILSSFYDPLGFLQPLVVTLKIFFQNNSKQFG